MMKTMVMVMRKYQLNKRRVPKIIPSCCKEITRNNRREDKKDKGYRKDDYAAHDYDHHDVGEKCDKFDIDLERCDGGFQIIIKGKKSSHAKFPFTPPTA